MQFRKVILSMICLISLVPVNLVNAAEKKRTDKVAPPADFLVQPILPKNNIGGQKTGYFNLKSAQKDQNLKIKVFNTTQYPLEIQTKIYNANTLTNGSIDYSGSKKSDSKILKQPGSDDITADKKIVVPKASSAFVNVTVKASDFKGVKASAINLIGKPQNQKGAISNRYVYAIGIILNGQKLKKTDYQKLTLNDLKIDAKKISVHLINPDANYLMSTQLDLAFKSAKYPLFQYHKEFVDKKIAPCSSVAFNLPFLGKRIVPGAYQLEIKNKNQAYQQTSTKYVRLSKNKITIISQKDYLIEKMKSTLLIAFVVVIITSLLLYRYQKKKGEKNEKIKTRKFD